MATRKYKKQRKGNLKKKSLGKKKRSMKKRGKSLKKRGGNGDGDNDNDLLIKRLANGDILPWAEEVNRRYKFLKDNRNPNTDIVNIPEIYKNRINQIYNRKNGKSLIQNFNNLSKGIITLEACSHTLSTIYRSKQMEFDELVCQAIKVMIYYQIIKQIYNNIEDKKDYPFYSYTNIPEMQKKIVDPTYDTKIYSEKDIDKMKKSINKKFIEHLGKVIKDFLKFYPHEKYPEGYKNTIEDQMNYYDNVIMKKILNTDSNFGDTESNLTNIYNQRDTNIEGENPMSSP